MSLRENDLISLEHELKVISIALIVIHSVKKKKSRQSRRWRTTNLCRQQEAMSNFWIFTI